MGTGEVKVAGVQINGFALAIVEVLREACRVRIKSRNKKEWVNPGLYVQSCSERT